MKKIISMLLAVIFMFCIFPVNALAEDINKPYEVNFTADELKENAGKKIDEILKLAKTYSLKSLVVDLPSGTFELEKGLHIYSNTTLNLQSDTILVRKFSSGNMLKLGVNTEINTGYSGYKNITINGGVWDSNYLGTSCAMRFAHCKNVTVNGVTVKNIKNAHHMELAAAKDFTVKNCSFSGYKRTNSNDGEAIQIDLIHNSYHFPSYKEYDDTPCKNITVTGCRFTDVYSGVGSGSGVIGKYFDNIKITDNYFENVRFRAIAAFNYKNSTISNNTIKNATIGILFQYYPYNDINRLFMPNDKSAKIKLNSNTNSTISDNTITVSRVSTAYKPMGIGVYGGTISKKTASSKNLYSGSYTVNGLKISSNTVNTSNSVSEGFYLKYLQNSEVINNKITSKTTALDGCNGITLTNCKSVSLISNKIGGKKYSSGISLKNSSTDITLSQNAISDTKKYGAEIDASSAAVINYGNTFKRIGKAKINVKGKNFSDYKKVINLAVTSKNSRANLEWNKKKGVTGYKIYRSTKKNGEYELIKTVKGAKNTSFVDKKVKSGKTYYYKIGVFKSSNKTKIYGLINEPVKIKIKR